MLLELKVEMVALVEVVVQLQVQVPRQVLVIPHQQVLHKVLQVVLELMEDLIEVEGVAALEPLEDLLLQEVVVALV